MRQPSGDVTIADFVVWIFRVEHFEPVLYFVSPRGDFVYKIYGALFSRSVVQQMCIVLFRLSDSF